MPNYKLVYFNIKGRAELTRWILEYGGIPYTDERISKEDWPELKKTIPGGQLPVLVIGEYTLHQSIAIARFTAREAGLVPEDNLKAAVCDALVDTLGDITNGLIKLKFSALSEEEMMKNITEEFIPNQLNPFLTRLNERLVGKEWFVSEKITWADISIASYISMITAKFPAVLETFPNVNKLVKKVLELPAIKSWIARRPVTEN